MLYILVQEWISDGTSAELHRWWHNAVAAEGAVYLYGMMVVVVAKKKSAMYFYIL